MTKLRFSVVIVNYNGRDFLQRCVDALSEQQFRDFEVIIADNASSDGSMEALDTSQLSNCAILMNDENLGFARGNNEAIRTASGEWLVLLNPDTVARPDWLAEIDAGIRRHADVKMFACTQYELSSNDILDGVGDAYLVFGFPWRGGFGHRANLLPPEGECFSPCGASAVLHTETFRAHEGFDERFFCYCEDVDLGFRMRLAGERCVFLPQAVVHHAGSGISGRNSDFSVYHGTRNRVWTYAKNMPWSLMILTLPLHLVLTIYLVMRKMSDGTADPMLRGLKDGMAQAVSIRRAPNWKVEHREVSLLTLARSMAWNPWRMSRRLPHVRTNGIPVNAPVALKA